MRNSKGTGVEDSRRVLQRVERAKRRRSERGLSVGLYAGMESQSMRTQTIMLEWYC